MTAENFKRSGCARRWWLDEEQPAIYCARTFDGRCLIADDDVNPYSFLLVTPDGSITSVRVDVDEFDDHDGLTIVGQKHEPSG